MVSEAPYSWLLDCKWCKFKLLVGPRGGRGGDQGAGVEAAERMKSHVEAVHGKTWPDFLSETEE